MRKKISRLCILFVSVCMVLTGCWDKIEIEQRGFVTTIMIDMAPPGYAEGIIESVKDIPGIEKQKGEMIKVTYSIPDARQLAEGGGGGGDQPGFLTLSSVATSVAKCNTYVDSRFGRRLYFAHLQNIVLGEDFLKNETKFREVMDLVDRSPQISRAAMIMACKGETSKISQLKPIGEKFLFRYIRTILENDTSNGRIVPMRFTDFVSTIRETGNGYLPVITPSSDTEAKIAGVAVIKGYKLVGYLSEYDSLYFNTLIGKRKGGRESLNTGDMAATFGTNNTTKKMKLLSSNPDKLEVAINSEVEGSIVEDGWDEDIADTEKIAKLEKEFESIAVGGCRLVIDKLQKDYNTDILEIGEYLRKFHPDTWEAVKNRWDEIYPTVKITPIIDYKIRRIGTAK